MKAELSNAERRERREQAREIDVPAVYRDRGYLILTLSRNAGHINYCDVRSGSYESMSAPMFDSKFTLAPESFKPVALALNLLGRASEGFWISVRVKRRLVAMASKEELLKLDNKALAKEYSRIMKIEAPISEIPEDKKEKFIDEMLAAIEKETAASESGVQGATAGTPTETPEGKETVKAKAKKVKAVKKDKKEKGEGRKSVTYPKTPASVQNPFREGSKKAKSFELYREGGERATLLGKMQKLGVKESSAATWLTTFRLVSEGKGPKPKEKKAPAPKKAKVKKNGEKK